MILIDADSVAYSCAALCDGVYYYIEDHGEFNYKKEAVEYSNQLQLPLDQIQKKNQPKPLNHCFYLLDQSIKSIIGKCGHIDYKVYLSGEQNFRYELYPEYKAHRAEVEKPAYLYDAREYLERKFGAEVVHGIEADDAIAIDYVDIDIIASIDKDLDQVPGLHYNYRTKEFYTVTPEQAAKSFYLSVLTGDPSDGIPGLPGVGKVTASSVLQDVPVQEMYETCLNKYKELGYDEDYLLLNAKLLYLHRSVEDEFSPEKFLV